MGYVGLYASLNGPVIVPDVMVGLDVRPGDDLFVRENRSWLTWVIGKPPEVAVAIVSDRHGGERTHKLQKYAAIRVSYYVVFDPRHQLSEEELHVFELRGGRYQRLEKPFLPDVGLGLTRWEGTYRGARANWLRWADANSNLIPTGEERAEQEHQRAEQERQRAEQAEQQLARLRDQLRALGIDPAS